VQRARVSSQAWKRAVRQEFKDIFEKDDLGYRTKDVTALLAKEIQQEKPSITEKEAVKQAEEALINAGVSMKKTKKGTDDAETPIPVADALLFISEAQIKALAKLKLSGEKDKKLYKAALKEHPSVDMALFGRMLASDPSANWDAAAQVAHAISTHGVNTEFDYFTAVDDLSPEDNAGAGHIGIVEFNSSTVYRYATVNVLALQKSLGLKAPEAAAGFLKAFVLSMPTGKQNTFANRTIPTSVYVSIRDDQPVSFAGAFEKAIPQSKNGYEKASEKAMAEYAVNLYDSFVSKPVASYTAGDALPELPDPVSFQTLVAEVKRTLSDLLAGLES
jgi:CRISPR system Cascade subunit CasC